MAKRSAGILVYRILHNNIEILLVHPGGPYFRKKDAGVWSIPKGEYEEGEDPLQVAIREFNEETGNTITASTFIALDPVKIASGKLISCWAVEQNIQQPFISSNEFEMEWPPRSGRKQSFPETDDARWFSLNVAKEKIYPSQLPIITSFEQKIIQDPGDLHL